jgi:AcrR family transcriptional regulator
VAEVADAAGISRATAYRYFSKPGDTVREALLDAVADAIQTTPPVGGDADRPQDVETQLDGLVRQVSAMVGAHKGMFRNFLANSLNDPAEMRRGSRRVDWLETVLLPLKPSLPPADLQRLLYALSLLTGIEIGCAPRHLPPQHRSSRIGGALGRAGAPVAHRRGSERHASVKQMRGQPQSNRPDPANINALIKTAL